MATVREGSKPVLLVVDVQVGVVSEAWETQRVVKNIALAVENARANDVPVVWVQHDDADFPAGSDAWALVPELKPAKGEPLISKQFQSSFEETELEKELARLGATHVILVGAATNWCIRSTAYAALDRGYDMTLVSDAHTTGDMEFSDGKRIPAASIIDELNTTLKWLSYPGRTSATVEVSSLDMRK